MSVFIYLCSCYHKPFYDFISSFLPGNTKEALYWLLFSMPLVLMGIEAFKLQKGCKCIIKVVVIDTVRVHVTFIFSHLFHDTAFLQSHAHDALYNSINNALMNTTI